MPKKIAPKKNKLENLDDRSKKILMWILVIIFTSLFILLGVFSFQSNLRQDNNSDNFSNFFSEFSDIKNKITDSFDKAKNIIWNQDEIVVSDEKIDEWDKKVFPEFK